MAWVGWFGWTLGWETLLAAAAPHILLAVRAVYVRRKKGRGEKRKEERDGGKRKQKENWKKNKPETSEVK
jgi:hypothetical protein